MLAQTAYLLPIEGTLNVIITSEASQHGCKALIPLVDSDESSATFPVAKAPKILRHKSSPVIGCGKFAA
jgi:hypothetical protein